MSIDKANDKKEALKGALGLTKHQITLATGAIVFSGTLLKLLLKPEEAAKLPSNLLFTSWGLLALSLLFGIFASGRYITQLSQSKYDIEDKLLATFGRIQQVAFFSGIVLFFIFAIQAWTRM